MFNHGWRRLSCKQEHDDDELYGVDDKDYDEGNREQEEGEGVGGSPDVDRLEILKDAGEAGNKWDSYGSEKATVVGYQGLPVRLAADERSSGGRAAKGGVAASIREKLSRLGRNHGLEIDDRLAEFLRCACLRRLRTILRNMVVHAKSCVPGSIHHVGKVRRWEGQRQWFSACDRTHSCKRFYPSS